MQKSRLQAHALIAIAGLAMAASAVSQEPPRAKRRGPEPEPVRRWQPSGWRRTPEQIAAEEERVAHNARIDEKKAAKAARRARR